MTKVQQPEALRIAETLESVTEMECMHPPEAKRIAKAIHAQLATHTTFTMGQYVRKKSGSQWQGRVVGYYSTDLTPEGYAVESGTERGSVQIYPAKALELVEGGTAMVDAAKEAYTPLAEDLLKQLKVDAKRYRHLRAKYWNDAPFCVVVNPKEAVKLGYDCPSLERLDSLIDGDIYSPLG